MSLNHIVPPDDRRLRLPGWAVLCVILGAVVLLAVFDAAGRFDLGRPTLFSTATIVYAVVLRWRLRRRLWFWTVVAVLAALHVALILLLPWTTNWIPAIMLVPLAYADVYLMLWAIYGVARHMGEPFEYIHPHRLRRGSHAE